MCRRVSQERRRGHVPECWEGGESTPWLSKEAVPGKLGKNRARGSWARKPEARVTSARGQ